MEEKHFRELLEKLDKIIKLLAAQTVGNKKGKDAIAVLSSFGFQPKEIAQLIRTTPHTVSVALNKMKEVKKNAKKE